MDSVSGDGIIGVFNSGFQGDPSLSLDILPIPSTPLQPEYFQSEDFNLQFLQTPSFSDTFLGSTSNTGTQRSSDIGFEWSNNLDLTPDPSSSLPLIPRGGNESNCPSNLPWLCTNSQPNSLSAKDNRPAVPAATRIELGESRLSRSVLDTTTSSQIWACDFQECSRVYQSHEKLR